MKLLKSILFLVLAILIFLPLSIDADDQDITDSGVVKLYANIGSTYTVKLPKSVDITEPGTTFDYYLKGDLDGKSRIVVSCPQTTTIREYNDGGVTLGESGHPDVTASMTNSNTDGFGYDVINSDYDESLTSKAKGTITIDHNGLPAGCWRGILNIKISLQ